MNQLIQRARMRRWNTPWTSLANCRIDPSVDEGVEFAASVDVDTFLDVPYTTTNLFELVEVGLELAVG
jgi:hypothetical protein